MRVVGLVCEMMVGVVCGALLGIFVFMPLWCRRYNDCHDAFGIGALVALAFCLPFGMLHGFIAVAVLHERRLAAYERRLVAHPKIT